MIKNHIRFKLPIQSPIIHLWLIGTMLLLWQTFVGQSQRNLFFNSFSNVIRLDFATEPPIPYGTGVAGSYEGIAHYEDGNGNILFWFNSTGVYDQNGTLMPGSFGILANSSSAEMCVAPMPGNPNRYFFLYNAETCSALYYAVIDMSLNGGLGNVVSVNTLISNAQHAEGMEVVRIPNTNNYWFITYRCGTGFTRYQISETGIGPGTVFHPYPMPAGGYDGRGNLDYHRGRIGAAFAWSSQVFTAEFDPINGSICNQITLSSVQFANNPFGVEFSPDASKMYFSLWYTTGQPNVFQYNFDTGIFTGYMPPLGGSGFISGLGEIEMGRNGKLYIIQDGGNNITVINNPNDNVPDFGLIPIPSSTGLGISDHIQSDVFDFEDNTITLCKDVGSSLFLQPPVAGNYAWTTSANPNMVIATGPSFWASAPSVATTYTATNIDVSSCLSIFNQQKWTVYPNPVVTATNNSPVCLGANVVLSAGSSSSGILGYQWIGPNGYSSFQQNPVINNAFFSDEGAYLVVAYGENGCTSIATTTVTVAAPPNAIASNTGPVCSGGNVMLMANASLSGTTSYLWNGPNGFISTLQNPTLNGVTEAQSGIYSLIVTVNGCASTPATTSITISPQPNLVANSNGPICLGSMLLLSASTTTTGAVNFQWSGPAGFSSTIQNPFIMNFQTANAGLYTVTVTAAGGCTATASVNVATNGAAIIAGINNISGTNTLTCGTSGINVVATGGVSYLWSGGNSPNTANNSFTSPGTYSVTITGANGCAASANITINQDAALPTANIVNNTGTTVLTCTTTNISLTATGGGTYNWGGGITSANRTITAPGTYTVTVTGANGCTASASIVITINNTPPTAGLINNTGTTTLTCTTTGISLTATGGGAYNWGGGITSANRTVTAPGTYTVTVTNSGNGCTASASIVITSNNTPPAAAITNNTGTNVLTCTTPLISLTATGGGTYNWGGGITSTNRTITAPGTYTVTVTNSSNGCTASASITITQNTSPPTAAITNNTGTTTLTCTTTGINLTATGGGTYIWNNGNTNANLSVTSEGTYTVTVTSINGCTASTSINITQDLLSPTAAITTNTGLSEINCNNPSIILTASGGTSYNWGSGTSTDPNFVVSTPAQPPNNIYTVTVTGNNGCTSTTNITISANFATPFISINSNTGLTSLTCTDTYITLTASGGESYNWGLGNTNPAITVNEPGTYTVTVTGVNGCTASGSATVTVEPGSGDLAIAGTASPTPTLTCFSQTEYIVAFVISGGAPPYWVNGTLLSGASYQSSLLNTFNYTFAITDAQGCTYTLTGNSAFCNPSCTVTATLQPVYYGAGCIDGFEVVVAEGPVTPPAYQYSVNGGEWQFSPQFTALPEGTYNVSVLTGCGIQSLGSFTQTQNPLLVSVAITPTGNNYQGSLSISGGSYPYSIFWSNGATGATANLGGLPVSGSVTVADADGCFRTIFFTQDGAVGIENSPNQNTAALNGLQVYPNPAYRFLTVAAPLPTATPAQLYLYTPLGQLVLHRQTHFTQPEVIDLLPLAQGLYLLVVAEGPTFRTFKVWGGGAR